jgi:hypothetical protein
MTAAGPLPLAAQQEAPVGSRVRLTQAPPLHQRLTGRLIGADSSTLTIITDRTSDTLTVQRSALRKMEVSLGRTDRAWTGLGIGAGAGVLTGAIIGLSSGDDPPDHIFSFTAGQKGVLYGAAGALAGGGLGVILGALTHGDHWAPAGPHPIPPLTAIVIPLGPGVEVGVRTTF